MTSILEEALDVTTHARADEYGNAEDSFSSIADYWQVYFQNTGRYVKIDSKDVSLLMVLFKMARENNSHKRDNLVDLCGYARLASKIQGDEISYKINNVDLGEEGKTIILPDMSKEQA